MKIIKEDFYFNGNYILEVKDEYIPKTVKAWYYETDTKIVDIKVEEIGAKFVSLDDTLDLEEKTRIQIEYGVDVEFKRVQNHERLLALEEQVENQQVVIKEILEALKYRVDINTFTVYLKSLEKQLGIEVFDNSFTKPYPSGSVKL